MRRKGQQAENDKTERVTGLGRRTREEIAKWNQMTALRFLTGGRHQTSPASLRGCEQNIHKHRTQNPRRTSPLGITPAEKAHKARTRWYRGPFRRFINTRFLKKSIKKMDRSNTKQFKILYKCITANTSVIWQHAAHTTDQLSSPNR